MAHFCPTCGLICHCHGDMDDIVFSDDEIDFACDHCDWCDDDDEYYSEDDDA